MSSLIRNEADMPLEQYIEKKAIEHNANLELRENIERMQTKITDYMQTNNYAFPSRIVLKMKNNADGIKIIGNIETLSLRVVPLKQDSYGQNYELILMHNTKEECFYLSQLEDITLI